MNDELGTAVGPHVATRAAIAYLTSLIGRAVLNVVSLPVDNGTATPVERSGPRLDALRPVVERGVRRSELRPDTDARLLLETLVAPLQGRLLLAGEPLSADLAEPIVDLVLYGATPR